MTELEKRAIEYTKNNMNIDSHILGLLVGFVKQETEFLSKHILELQADKGKLTDEIKELKENKPCSLVNCNGREARIQLKKAEKQLNKAKEIIQGYYEIHSKIYDLAEDEELLLTKAKAFLQEQD